MNAAKLSQAALNKAVGERPVVILPSSLPLTNAIHAPFPASESLRRCASCRCDESWPPLMPSTCTEAHRHPTETASAVRPPWLNPPASQQMLRLTGRFESTRST